jgi:hypothetical protein
LTIRHYGAIVSIENILKTAAAIQTQQLKYYNLEYTTLLPGTMQNPNTTKCKKEKKKFPSSSSSSSSYTTRKVTLGRNMP